MSVHPTAAAIERYASGGPGLDEATVWAVEVHLEDCAGCRARLAGSTTDASRATVALVADRLDREIVPFARPGLPLLPVRRRWAVTVLAPWVIMTVAVLVSAALLGHFRPDMPSVVLLLAPLAPLPGVAVAWNRRTDPAWELIAGTPPAGLTMMLRRTAAVLVVIIPVLAVTGAGASLPLLLLPCLAFTAATLLLGTSIGVHRAAVALMAAWAAVVVLPSLLRAHLPVVLSPSSTGVWVALTVVLFALTLLRADGFRRLTSH